MGVARELGPHGGGPVPSIPVQWDDGASLPGRDPPGHGRRRISSKVAGLRPALPSGSRQLCELQSAVGRMARAIRTGTGTRLERGPGRRSRRAAPRTDRTADAVHLQTNQQGSQPSVGRVLRRVPPVADDGVAAVRVRPGRLARNPRDRATRRDRRVVRIHVLVLVRRRAPSTTPPGARVCHRSFFSSTGVGEGRRLGTRCGRSDGRQDDPTEEHAVLMPESSAASG